MKICGWKTEAIAKRYIGAIYSGRVRGGKKNAARATRTLAGFLCRPSLRKISQHVRDRVEACVRKFG